MQSYLHSSYKALSRQLSLVTAWSRGMAEGKRIHRHVSERRVLPLNDLSFTRNESGPSTGARCHAPTQCQSKSSQQQQSKTCRMQGSTKVRSAKTAYKGYPNVNNVKCIKRSNSTIYIIYAFSILQHLSASFGIFQASIRRVMCCPP